MIMKCHTGTGSYRCFWQRWAGGGKHFRHCGSCAGQGNRGLAKCLKAMTVDRKEKNQTKQEEGVGGRK